MEQMRRSLEELFSDFSPPPPEGQEMPRPREEAVSTEEIARPARAETPSPAPSAKITAPESGPLIGAHVRNIRTQLLGNALITLVLVLWIGLLIGSSVARINDAMANLERATSLVNAALSVSRTTADLFVAIGHSAASRDRERFVQKVAEAQQQMREAQSHLLAIAEVVPRDDPLRPELARLRASAADLDSYATFLISQAQRGLWNAIDAMHVSIIPYYSAEIREANDQIERLTRQRHEVALAEADAARRMMRDVSIAWGAVLVLALVGLQLATLRSIAQPVEQLQQAASRLAAGHLDERVPVERDDEFGRLSFAFNQMADQLQALYNELEERVAERTRALQEANYALQRRAIQLEASAEVSRAIISVFNVDELLRRAVNLIRDRFGFYHAGIFLIDETGQWAVLREATGEAGEKMKAMGHRLPVEETSMVGWTALHRRPRIALDVGKDAVRFANPLLPYTRSEMTLPLMVGERLLGVLNVQSTEEAAFDEDDIRTLQSMADQLAIAIENARRISDEAMLLEAASPIFRASRLLTTAANLDEVGQAIVKTIAETGAEGCFLALFEPPEGQPEAIRFVTTWRQDGQSPILPGARFPIAAAHMRLETMQQLWSVSDLDQPSLLTEEEVKFFRRTGMRAVANIPLRIGEQPLGFIVAYRRSAGPFPVAALRLYEALTDMASVAVERVRLTATLQQRAQQEEALRVIADQMTATFDFSQMLQTTLDQLSKALNATGGYVELGVR